MSERIVFLRWCFWPVQRSGWGSVMSLYYLCRWLVQVSVYCARWMPAHLKYTQC